MVRFANREIGLLICHGKQKQDIWRPVKGGALKYSHFFKDMKGQMRTESPIPEVEKMKTRKKAFFSVLRPVVRTRVQSKKLGTS